MRLLGTATVDDTPVRLQWSADGRFLAVASLSGAVRAFTRTLDPTHTFSPHPGGALSVGFSPDGSLLASGGQDGRVRIHSISRGALLHDFDAAGPWVTDTVWNGDGTLLATAAGRVVRFWSPDGSLIGAVSDHASTVTSLHWHPVCGWSSACYGGVNLLSPTRTQPIRRLPFRGSVLTARPSPDGSRIASGNQDASVRYWDLHARNDTSLRGYPGKVRVLAWSSGPDGPMLATGGGSDVVAWRCADMGPLNTVAVKARRHRARVSALDFVDNGSTLVSAGEDGRVCMWTYDPAEGFALADETPEGDGVYAMAVDAATRTVAAGLRGGGIKVWELPPRALLSP